MADASDKIIPLADAKRREQARNQPAPEPETPDDSEFRPLGHNHGRYYFLARRSGQIVELSAREIGGTGALLSLAPLHYWEREYPKKGAFDRDAAINALIQSCLKQGVFSASRCRGRGAWYDEKRIVLHLGDHLLVDNERVSVSGFKTKFIYEEGESFGVELGQPLNHDEARQFLDLCEMLRWERPWMATLLAGWCVIAPICGALSHRPHIWITGESGSGKTYLHEKIIKPALAGIALCVQSKTTEAYLRQALKSDARPVIFDEAEAENLRDRERIQGVLDLARAASSEDSAPIGKGGKDGDGAAYRIRSAMAFSSINPMLQQQADENRVTVLALLGGEAGDHDARVVIADHFDKLRATVAQLLTADFSVRLLARSLSLLPTIKINAETYARACAEVLPSRRNGDQIGALLAGAALLHHSRKISLEEARDFIAKTGWIDEAIANSAAYSDQEKLLSFLCEHQITLRQGNGSSYDRTFGDLIAQAAGAVADDRVLDTEVPRILARHGIRVEADGPNGTLMVYFAGAHSYLARVLRDTPWAVQWGRPLARIPGSVKPEKAIRFGPGAVKKAVGIPVDSVLKRGKYEIS